MAFELPPLPSFQVQIPDLTAKALEGAQLRNMMSEMSLRQALAPGQIQLQQQQVQQQQIATQMQQMQLQDSRIMSDYLKNGDVGDETPTNFSQRDRITSLTGIDANDPIMRMLSGLAKKGYSGPGLLVAAQNALQKRNEYLKGTEELQAVQKTERLLWADQLAALRALPEDQRGAQLAAKLPLLQENTKGDPLLAKYAGLLNGHPEAIDEAYNVLLGENDALGLRKAKAEATEAEQKVIGPTGVSPQQTAELTKEQAEQPMKLQLATAEAAARERMQLAMKPLELQIQQQFANQKDARDKIESTVLKPYQDKMTDITTARAALAQAQDNPVAARAAIFKMIGVAQPAGSHRVLPAEITAFQYPGGIADRVKERFNNFLKGEPWTPEIAEAASSFINGQEGAAQTNLNSGIDRTNKLYGTSVGRGLQQTPQGETRTYQGRTYAKQPDGTWKLQ